MSNLFLPIFAPKNIILTLNSLIMKKHVLLLVLAALAFPMVAEEIPVATRKKLKEGNPESRPHMPVRIPEMGVSYDSGTHVLKVVCDTQAEGEVYLYDLNGTLEGFSPVLNCELDVPSTGAIHVLYIDGGGWTGEAKFTD